VGIVVTLHPYKQRFARPIKVQIHIPFYKKPNPFVGLEKFVTWDSCGIIRGKCLTEKEYEKLSPADQKSCHKFLVSADMTDKDVKEINNKENQLKYLYAQPKDTARTLVCKHLGGEVPLSELYTEKVFTEDVLKQLDENIIKKTFMLPSIESLEDLAEATEELAYIDMGKNSTPSTQIDELDKELDNIDVSFED
jgi:hypothetical protein